MKKITLWFLMTFLLIPCFVKAQNLREDPRVKSALNLLEMWVQFNYETNLEDILTHINILKEAGLVSF